MVGIVAVMYFFMMRPQMQRQKAQVAFQNGLEKGQDVVTTSGIIGKISAIQNNVVTLQLGEKIFIKVLRSAVSKEMTEAFASGKDVAELTATA